MVTNPQNTSNSNAAQAKSRQGIKTLITTASLAATLGGWAMLASDHELVSKTAKGSKVVLPRPTDVSAEFIWEPLPTLISPSVITRTAITQSIAISQPAPQPTLRSVNNPPPMRVIHVGGGGDGGDGGGGNQGSSEPAAQTSSSR